MNVKSHCQKLSKADCSDEGDEEESEAENDNEPMTGWDMPFNFRPLQLRTKTKLIWGSFRWELHRSMYFKGTSNWIAYKEALLTQIEGIGYLPGMRLTPLYEVKLVGVVQSTSTSTPEAQIFIRGLKQGTKITRTFEATFQQVGHVQQETTWDDLTSLKYKGGCPLKFVMKFRTTVNNFFSVGGKLSKSQMKTIFKTSVKDKASSLYGMASNIPQSQDWTAEQLYQNFISQLYQRVDKEPKADDKQVTPKSLHNTQSRDHRGKKAKDSRKSVRCWKCKEEGHYSNKCPKKKANAQGADVDATNDKKNLTPESVIEFKPKQFSVLTGIGVTYADCMGEVLLPLKGPQGTHTVLRLKYVVCLRELPSGIISGERFYRCGGYLDHNRFINPEGVTITH
ncbi:hypothetical protein EV44_g3760 [Erysiphe necator]|uniref:CCHC-type domain-containing protein n=1 Tax=Uncinula necator TaxID=52586 RepID=A0A0B1P5M4_UNCNE|nr:hypothetical protein EV44_g3760 [Erysiphe necator]